MWDLIVSVPDHCLSFYFIIKKMCNVRTFVTHEYEISFVHTYVTYENVIWPNLCYAQKYDI